MIRFKQIILFTFILSTMAALCSCNLKSNNAKDDVTISIWTGEKDYDMLNEMLDDFKTEYKDKANFTFNVSLEGEDTCKERVLSNPDGAADIYTFADDQFEELWLNGVLLEITDNTDKIISDNGGKDSGAANAVTRDDKIYAYPLTAGNGYFLYYNNKYFTENDVKDLDTILDICADNDKYFSMDFESGWYIYSFFKGAGLDLECNLDGTSNSCNWNATDTEYTGVDVLNAMFDIATNKGFKSGTDTEFTDGVESGDIIAGVNGAWNAEVVANAWGDNYAACKLPEYSIKDTSVQMCSFTGYKLVGINSNTENPEWCMKLAEYITSEENQLKRFEEIGECPANVNLADNEEVKASPAVAALAEQAQFGYIQSVADTFWNASNKLGITIESGNLDGIDYQQLLDDTVAEITK